MPLIPQYETIDIELLINGENNHLHTYVETISVGYKVNKIPFAQIKLTTHNHLKKNQIRIGKSVSLDDEIEIKIKEGGELKTLFKGLIVTIKKTISSGALHLMLECKDLTSKLLSSQKVIPDENFQDMFDRFLNHHSINNLVKLKSFGGEHISIIDQEQPWDFILSYLDALGFLTTIKEGDFSAIHISEQEDASIELRFGANIFDLEYQKKTPVSSVVIKYWDVSDQETKTVEAVTELEYSEGKEVIDLGQTNLSLETIKQFAKALAAKNRIASFSGRVKTNGNLQANYGDYLRLVDAGEDLEGKALLITAEHHSINRDGWKTEYFFGLENINSYAENISAIKNTKKNQLSRLYSIPGLGSQLVFDGEKKSIEMNTPDGNTILISDDESGIILKDQNGNKIQMDSRGIHIESAGDINLKAIMNTNIDGVQNSFKASGVMKIEGSIIQLN